MGVVLYHALPVSAGLLPNPWLRLALIIMAGTLVYGLALIALSPLWREQLVRTLQKARR